VCRRSDGGRAGGRRRRCHAVLADQRLRVVEPLGRVPAPQGALRLRPRGGVAWPPSPCHLRQEGACCGGLDGEGDGGAGERDEAGPPERS